MSVSDESSHDAISVPRRSVTYYYTFCTRVLLGRYTFYARLSVRRYAFFSEKQAFCHMKKCCFGVFIYDNCSETTQKSMVSEQLYQYFCSETSAFQYYYLPLQQKR